MEFCNFEIDVVVLQMSPCPLRTHTQTSQNTEQQRAPTGHTGPALATSALELQQEHIETIPRLCSFIIGQVFLNRLEEHRSQSKIIYQNNKLFACFSIKKKSKTTKTSS